MTPTDEFGPEGGGIHSSGLVVTHVVDAPSQQASLAIRGRCTVSHNGPARPRPHMRATAPPDTYTRVAPFAGDTDDPARTSHSNWENDHDPTSPDPNRILPKFLPPSDHPPLRRHEQPPHMITKRPADLDKHPGRRVLEGVELRGFEPLTPTLPVWCATSCATAPCACSKIPDASGGPAAGSLLPSGPPLVLHPQRGR